VNGYHHPAYALSLAGFGSPRELPRCGGWILERRIPGYTDRDGMGCYPLFVCSDWSALRHDVRDLDGALVSLALVTDPFGSYALSDLEESFDTVTRFKEHFVADLSGGPGAAVSSHHRYYARRALKSVSVEVCKDPPAFLDEWLALYAELVRRHRLRGIKAFSRDAFARQLQVPGLVLFRAVSEGATVGAHLWYVEGDVAYSHLAATSEEGYRLRAPYAIYWRAMEVLFDRNVRWLGIGAGGGTQGQAPTGLTEFKRGWASATRPSYFCTRILDAPRYADVVRDSGARATEYFPAYRAGELA